MSLPSPLSVGDVILLGQIAYKVARALSSGAKSAPAEFLEVQALLLSLKEAFDLLSKAFAESGCGLEGGIDQQNMIGIGPQAQSPLASILASCRDVLAPLETIVGQYSMLDPCNDEKQETMISSLKKDLKKNWKKIAWTKEGGDIIKLKQTLTAHTNALHLAITATYGYVLCTFSNLTPDLT